MTTLEQIEFQMKTIHHTQTQLNEQKKELRSLQDKYIEENAEFKVGEKAWAVIDERIGFGGKLFEEERKPAFILGSFMIKKDIHYKLVKCKKDGTPSKHRLRGYDFDRIEKYGNKELK